MIKAHAITSENAERIAGIYEHFCAVAREKYRWDHDPVSFDVLKGTFNQGFLHGYYVEDTSQSEPIAFMLYVTEEHRALEINVIYVHEDALAALANDMTDLTDDYVANTHESLRKNVVDRLMRAFVADVRDQQSWDTVSYAMLGLQEPLVRTICWYGFKPVGQAITKFPIMDAISLQILKSQPTVELPEGYRLDTWKPEYAGGVAEAVHEAFSTAKDSLWDPRFRTLIGTRRVVGTLTQGMMGKFIPTCTSVLLNGDEVVGFCFVLQASMTSGNIPLIGVKPSEKGKKLGNALLRHSLDRVVDEILAGNIGMLDVSATHDTDNIGAIKMYRRMGFREAYNYPHVYLSHDVAKTIQVGKWC